MRRRAAEAIRGDWNSSAVEACSCPLVGTLALLLGTLAAGSPPLSAFVVPHGYDALRLTSARASGEAGPLTLSLPCFTASRKQTTRRP
jgi:hypothetical protein